MCPKPADLTEDRWYDWCVAHWGTKWDVDTEGLELVEEDGRARIEGYADSAWGPPVEAFKAYADLNEDVSMELKYFEPGMSFVGQWDTNGVDGYWDDVGDLVADDLEDDVLAELFEHFDVGSYYEDLEEDFEENLEIDLDGGLSNINE